MQWSRVKTLLICLLVAVDLFLLGDIFLRSYRQHQQQEQLWDNTVSVLENRSITLSEEVSLPQQTPLEWYTLSRSREREASAAQALLGPCEQVSGEQGDEYRSEYGHLLWSADGAVEGTVQNALQQAPESAEQAEEFARELLANTGMDLDEWSVTAAARRENYRVVLRHTGAERPVFNEQLELLLKIDLSVDLSGRWCLGDITLSGWQSVAGYAPADVLLTAMADWSDLEILGMDYGYVLTADSAGQLGLSPTWRVRTETREILMDADKNTVLSQEYAA